VLEFGITFKPTMPPARIVGLTRQAEAAGFGYGWCFDSHVIWQEPYPLLALMAANTARMRLGTCVTNPAARDATVTASLLATLNRISGGRMDCGIGRGDSSRRVMGKRPTTLRRLEETVAVVRALTAGEEIVYEGQAIHLPWADGGVPPVWIAGYGERALRCAGRLADGVILQFADPHLIAWCLGFVRAGAVAAGRDPAAIRRAYNINGRFAAQERGYLQGPPQMWIEQLTELALEQGMSVFILGPGADAAGDLRRFAEEVAPGVREMVERARREDQPPTPPVESEPPAPVVTSAMPQRTGQAPRAAALDEDKRPHVPPTTGAPVTPIGRESQETLLQVHEHLRTELAEIREAAAQVAAGSMDPAAARTLLNRMAMRQNYWTLGAFCAQYCRVVSIHHTIEDYQMFPSLRREDKALGPVLDRLHWEHEVIAEQIDRIDRALVAMMNDPARITEVQRAADELGDMLLSHLAYEEDQLLGPLGRLDIVV
jgi:alkanesulfonate monooxygenase SsuD/methylene tetrahydromethanopterin reductase-like flavin-dependent oxidoreductase (luciferase family)/hemerythrin-like domain-containing protein